MGESEQDSRWALGEARKQDRKLGYTFYIHDIKYTWVSLKAERILNSVYVHMILYMFNTSGKREWH